MIENVPKGARPLFGECLAVAADAMLDADESIRVGGDVLAMLIPRLLLTPLSSSWWSTTALREFRRRCKRFLSGEWEELFEDSKPFAAGKCDATGAAQREEVQHMRRKDAEFEDERTERQRQLDYSVQLVKKGLVGKAAAFLQSEGTAPTNADTAGKLGAMQFSPHSTHPPDPFT